jgi:hypothetical protein
MSDVSSTATTKIICLPKVIARNRSNSYFEFIICKWELANGGKCSDTIDNAYSDCKSLTSTLCSTEVFDEFPIEESTIINKYLESVNCDKYKYL